MAEISGDATGAAGAPAWAANKAALEAILDARLRLWGLAIRARGFPRPAAVDWLGPRAPTEPGRHATPADAAEWRAAVPSAGACALARVAARLDKDGRLSDAALAAGALTPEAERARRAWHALRSAFVEANLGLAVSRAKRYAGAGWCPIELRQVAATGLQRAVDRFDLRRGTRISTYADAWVRHEVQRSPSAPGLDGGAVGAIGGRQSRRDPDEIASPAEEGPSGVELGGLLFSRLDALIGRDRAKLVEGLFGGRLPPGRAAAAEEALEALREVLRARGVENPGDLSERLATL